MVTISDIKYGKNSASMLVNGALQKNVSIDALIQHGIVEGVCTEEKYKRFSSFNEICQAKKYVLGLLSRGNRTEYDCRKKMREKGYSSSAIQKAIEFAKEYGYIDDQAFAKLFVEINKNKKGYYRISYELKQKGVAESIINNVLNPDKNNDEEGILIVSEKFMRSKDKSEKNIEKLYRHLVQKGFSYELIKRVIERYKS